jgi:hypothetical protein
MGRIRDGYARYHQSRVNLLLHIVLVPLFPVGNVALVTALVQRSWTVALVSAAAMAISIAFRFATRSDYLDFYMGTSMVRHRADLTPVYQQIFRRMRQLGLDWRYVHPRLMAVDLRPLQDALESEQVSEALRYNSTENFWRERKEAARDTELAGVRRNLDDAYRASVAEARNALPPATVRAYRQVYRRFPTGWPPQVESGNDDGH